ncbi:hypothetical protein DFH94DRAFT_738162 [Russula ochroleuca]|jgi:uncharacterized membrane protein|uniref:Uncharacterized protein n=1 Tax=Russula ochroleuca TaxID=152965 RepID=A0A9P5T9Y5_9AGAM|nr:hypothetical protein DFH94DRAFT_738162 [Russula ochroleuca]
MSLNAISFAPYTPPPDDPGIPSRQPSTSRFARPWFPPQPSTREVTSYQSGGIPTWETAIGGGSGADEEVESQIQNQWETRYGMRVDLLAAWAYILGPVTAFGLLVMETHNDFIRFHAYQSALLTTPLILLRILASLLQLSSFLRTVLTLLLVSSVCFMAFRAHTDAARNGLTRFHVPFIGQVAERWLDEE